jgi:hypothetical protein
MSVLLLFQASFVSLAGARDYTVRRNVTWLDQSSVLVQLASATELAAVTAAVSMLDAEGSPLPWGGSARFGSYEHFLRRHEPVFGRVCDAELLPPTDEDRSDRKRRRDGADVVALEAPAAASADVDASGPRDRVGDPDLVTKA